MATGGGLGRVVSGVIVNGADALAAQLRTMGKVGDARMERLIRHYGYLLQTRVKARASGRPGPNVVTGDYRRSIGVQFYRDPKAGFVAVIGTNKPQGARLEFGFHGMDSLGRSYDQPPYPHFGPAFDQTKPELESAADLTVTNLIAEARRGFASGLGGSKK